MATETIICGIPVGEVVGEGIYGKIHRIKNENKVIKVSDDDEYIKEGIPQPLELVVLTQLRHENLMWAERVVGDASCKGVSWVMPYGISDLHKYIPIATLTVYQRLDICFRVTCAVKFLLDNKILHLDLKPTNVIMEKVDEVTVRPLLSDFGMAVVIDDPKVPITLGEREVISIHTRPPENLPSKTDYPYGWTASVDQRTYGEHTLVWGLGMIFQYVFSSEYINTSPDVEHRHHPNAVEFFTAAYIREWYEDDAQRRHTIETFTTRDGTLDIKEPIAGDIINLISAMLNYDPKKRLTLEAVIGNSVFRHLSATMVLDDKRSIIEGKLVSIPIPPITDTGVATVERLLSEAKSSINNMKTSAAVVFDAVDLMYRGLTLIPLDTSIRRKLYSKVCLFIGWKLHEWKANRSIYVTDIERLNVDELMLFLTMERELVVALGGQLRRPYIYDACSSTTFEQALEAITSPRRYLTMDLATLHGPNPQVKPPIIAVFKDRPYTL